MKSNVLLFEGYDGSGKTTLIQNFQKYIAEKGHSSLIIGRDFNKVIKNITFAIKDKETEITPRTEILLRFAREYERIKILRDNISKYNYLILDRSIISTISWIYYYNCSFEDFRCLATSISEEIGICKLIYCHLPFQTSWNRITSRGSLSKKELMGEKVNKMMYDALLQTFNIINYSTMDKIEITTQKSRADCLKELILKLGNDTLENRK